MSEIVDLMKKWVKIYDRKKSDEAALKVLKDEMKTLETEITDEMINQGLQNMTVDGKTMSVVRKFYAGMQAGMDSIDALDAAGMKSCLMVSSSRISALVREHLDLESEQCKDAGVDFDQEAVMDAFISKNSLEGLLTVGEKISLSTRKKG